MTTRRDFVATLGALGASLTRVPRVEARATVFYAPDGVTNLIRFTITGLDAPAGRLRAYDGRSRLVGTAGVINTGGSLVGELWLRLDPSRYLLTELEAPGLRGVHRTGHRLTLPPKWTIHWMSVVDRDRLIAQLGEPGSLERAVRAAVFRASGVAVNPLDTTPAAPLDPLELLHLSRPAASLARDTGVPLSSIAWHDGPDPLDAATVMVLAGSGVSFVARAHDGDIEWWSGLDGSRVLAVPIRDGASLRSLGFAQSAGVMASRVERWIATLPQLRATPSGTERSAFVIDRDLDAQSAVVHDAAREWNARYASPRLVQGIPDLGAMATATAVSGHRAHVPGRASARPNDNSAEWVANRVPSVFAALLSNGRSGLDAIASAVRTDFAGTVVCNPTPFPKSDVVVIDGHARSVTNVPPLGYAFFPSQAPGESAAVRETTVAEGARYRVALDARDGSIVSIVDRARGTEWVGDRGMNVVTGSQLERSQLRSLPGVGVELIAERWVSGIGRLMTTVQLFDAVPAVSIRNDAVSDPGVQVEYGFAFAGRPLDVSWDVAGGHFTAVPPARDLRFGRWVWLRGEQNGFFWGSAHRCDVFADGVIYTRGQASTEFRVASDTLPATPADAARFGWSGTPLSQHEVAPNASGRLPRFGSLLELDQPSAAIVALHGADRFATSVTVYVQDLLGASRMLGIVKGLLDFDDARAVDYVGRATEQLIEADGTGVRFLTQPYGITAIELLGTRLRET